VPGRSVTNIGVDAQKKDGLVKILAEPTVMAISGHQGSFLAGGKIFIPVAQTNVGGGVSFELEERTFGVKLIFRPTVLADGRINLEVRPEVSELSSTGITISSSATGATSVLPVITTREAQTTVQLFDGQSFAIGGLIKNNVTTNMHAFPIWASCPSSARFPQHQLPDRPQRVGVRDHATAGAAPAAELCAADGRLCGTHAFGGHPGRQAGRGKGYSGAAADCTGAAEGRRWIRCQVRT